MIWAALGILLWSIFGGGDSEPGLAVFEAVEERLSGQVREDVRRKAALAVLAEMKSTRAALVKKVEALGVRFHETYASHAASRADIEKIFSEIEAARLESWKAQVDARFRLKASLTRQEWDAVFSAARR